MTIEKITEFWNKLSDFIDNIIQSYPVTILRIISGIVSFLLFIFVVFLKKDTIKLKFNRWKTFLFHAGIEDRQFINQWKEVIRLAKKGDNLSNKESILKADILVINVLIDVGIQGRTFEEKIENAKEKYSIENSNDLIRIHNVIRKHIEERNSETSKEEVVEILSFYEKLLKKLELI
jgi:hypothetical protein